MAKLTNLIFYNEKWGSCNVIWRENNISFIPDIQEIVVVNSFDYYRVLERIMDFSENVVHLRVEKLDKCLDLAI